ncbi:FRG domain-containing protein, partial [Enterococcus faecalis]
NTSATFIDEFEKIYKRISIEFPNEIEYTEYETNPDSLKKRAKQLAMLQHYGLRTSLLDLTRNPYIALLFMVSDSSKTDFSSGVIEAYQIDEDKHNQNNIFI